jgi:hypothetical protein
MVANLGLSHINFYIFGYYLVYEHDFSFLSFVQRRWKKSYGDYIFKLKALFGYNYIQDNCFLGQ